MKKILVTTDFSGHSKAGMRFAIQLATQKKAELVFFYCFQAMLPTTIQGKFVDTSVQKQAKTHLQKLEKFVAGQLSRVVQKAKPSLVGFFTHTNKTWFDKLFSISRSESFSFITKVPMLVYRKN